MACRRLGLLGGFTTDGSTMVMKVCCAQGRISGGGGGGGGGGGAGAGSSTTGIGRPSRRADERGGEQRHFDQLAPLVRLVRLPCFSCRRGVGGAMLLAALVVGCTASCYGLLPQRSN